MSQSQSVAAAQPFTANRTPTIVDDDEAVNTLLDALNDAQCRRILAATEDEALSASELAETCGLALSTTYRKLDTLTEVGLLSECLRISRSGKHTAEYRRAIDDVTVTVSPEGVSLCVTPYERETNAPIPA